VAGRRDSRHDSAATEDQLLPALTSRSPSRRSSESNAHSSPPASRRGTRRRRRLRRGRTGPTGRSPARSSGGTRRECRRRVPRGLLDHRPEEVRGGVRTPREDPRRDVCQQVRTVADQEGDADRAALEAIRDEEDDRHEEGDDEQRVREGATVGQDAEIPREGLIDQIRRLRAERERDRRHGTRRATEPAVRNDGVEQIGQRRGVPRATSPERSPDTGIDDASARRDDSGAVDRDSGVQTRWRRCIGMANRYPHLRYPVTTWRNQSQRSRPGNNSCSRYSRGRSCDHCPDGELERGTYKDNRAIVCDSCGTPCVQVWSASLDQYSSAPIQASPLLTAHHSRVRRNSASPSADHTDTSVVRRRERIAGRADI